MATARSRPIRRGPYPELTVPAVLVGWLLGVAIAILAFVDARASIAHAAGTRVYAEVMSHFAAGERYLNRAWCTAVDGYVDEAHAALSRSRAEFLEALARFEASRPAAR